ncbi:hypothetical protein AVEN_45317-1 [Araneus ventricosus]|uniref:Uncharacterized protein n=1 Tax=Araneus ventricosus TaxID=182803 RepID=A0A4Y2U357_ARAVE|nr:hypothetical protein AVEN_45317-1 [Araneus ventricosus]
MESIRATSQSRDRRRYEMSPNIWLDAALLCTTASQHGREHFCPLSVFRVVGYSMVYEYEVIEEEQRRNKNDSEMNGAGSVISEDPLNSAKTYSSIKQITLHTKLDSDSKGDAIPVKLCQMMQKYCSTTQPTNASWNQPMCLFLEIVIFKYESPCAICTKELSTQNFVSATNSIVKSGNLKANERSESYTKYNTLKNASHVEDKAKTQNLSDSTSALDEPSTDFSVKELSRSVDQHYPGARPSQISTVSNATRSSSHKIRSASQTGGKVSKNIRQSKEKSEIPSSVNQCDCSKVSQAAEKISPKQNSSSEALLFEQDVAESAALIQKESVLVKMNVRIKTLETNLSLINRYLQQLSESYRMQVEDTLNMFDGTIKAITVTSAKAAIVSKNISEKGVKLGIGADFHDAKAYERLSGGGILEAKKWRGENENTVLFLRTSMVT